jgi:RNA polymerase sigma-70 factor, ECF subfamily
VHLDETEIVNLLKAGEKTVFEQLFKEHYKPLCSYANTILKDIDLAEEMVQNMFVKLWEKRQMLNITVSVKSYLFRSVHNVCLNNIKHEKIKQVYKEYNAEQYRNNFESATQKIYGKELEAGIYKAIEKLPQQCKLIFKMSRFEELKYKEIAETLEISVKTVENQMSKALKIMREELVDFLPFIITILSFIKNY